MSDTVLLAASTEMLHAWSWANGRARKPIMTCTTGQAAAFGSARRFWSSRDLIPPAPGVLKLAAICPFSARSDPTASSGAGGRESGNAPAW